ncbi:MAG TPA: hypothetical protein VMZ26_08840 [Pyrinomonadaceae bacterium]|nr:hypothetical protein [Pyrinomonadaceae bacterium]
MARVRPGEFPGLGKAAGACGNAMMAKQAAAVICNAMNFQWVIKDISFP